MTRTNLIIVAALVLAACGGAQTSAAIDESRDDEHGAHAAHAQGGGGMAGMCPMMVENTTVVAEEAEGGAALVFTTSGDVDELRRRVARMAEMHARRSMRGGGMMGQAEPEGPEAPAEGEARTEPERPGSRGAHRGMMMPRADARVEEVERGARLVLTPRDPAELASLREHVQRMAERMAARECPMMAHTARKRGRDVLAFITACCASRSAGTPAPSLLAAS